MSRGDDALELDSRREIFQAVERNPGIHFRELERRLDYSVGTLQYHLKYLVDEGLLDEEKGDYTRYYPRRRFEEFEKTALDAMRRKYARRILAYLLTHPGSSHGDLVDALGKAPSTISWHLKRLRDEGLVDERRDGGSREIYVVEPDRVKELYVTYRGSFLDRLVDNMVDLWDIK